MSGRCSPSYVWSGRVFLVVVFLGWLGGLGGSLWLGFLGSFWLPFPTGVSSVADFWRFVSYYRVFVFFFPVLVVFWVVPFGQLVGWRFVPELFVGSSFDVLLVYCVQLSYIYILPLKKRAANIGISTASINKNFPSLNCLFLFLKVYQIIDRYKIYP